MKKILLTTLVLWATQSQAQYFYKDIIGNQVANSEMVSYKNSTIHEIKIISYEADGTITPDFFCVKKISKKFDKTTLYSHSLETGASILESTFNPLSQIIKTYDSSELSNTVILFDYDFNNKIRRIKTSSISKNNKTITKLEEEHVYTYDSESRLQKLLVIKNNLDTTVILFSTDEYGNVILEKDTKTAAKYYYYYDAKNRLTDVVHTNERTQKPVADYIIDYNSDNQMETLKTSESENGNFLIWKYDYENKLRIKERVFSKNEKFMGKIEYQYQ
jgi:hypothetical protein